MLNKTETISRLRSGYQRQRGYKRTSWLQLMETKKIVKKNKKIKKKKKEKERQLMASFLLQVYPFESWEAR